MHLHSLSYHSVQWQIVHGVCDDNNAEGKREEACERQAIVITHFVSEDSLRSCTQSEHYFLSYNTMNDLVEFLRTHEEAFRRYMALSNILAPNRTALTPITVATAFNRSTQTSAYKRHQTRMDTKRTPERGCAV
jgi:Rps23 Pro-64 3,4-dihydroxylase Tpa1-like proline 4-hydroxylase